MREKWIQEDFPYWMSFESDKTDVSDVNQTYCNVDSEATAKKVAKAHNVAVDALIDIVMAWSESDNDAFAEYWFKRK
jgi:hypothetical protein